MKVDHNGRFVLNSLENVLISGYSLNLLSDGQIICVGRPISVCNGATEGFPVSDPLLQPLLLLFFFCVEALFSWADVAGLRASAPFVLSSLSSEMSNKMILKK